MAGAQALQPRSESEPLVVHPKVLTRLHDDLVKNINFDSLHDQLISSEAFDDTTLSDMKEETKTSGRIRALLDVLKKGDLHTYVKFKNGLETTKQGHIVERLVKEEKNVIAQCESEARLLQSRSNEPKKGVKLELPSNPQDADGDGGASSSHISQPASSFGIRTS